MKKILLTFLFVACYCSMLHAQKPVPKKNIPRKDSSGLKVDSLVLDDIKQNVAENITVITMDDADLNNEGSQNVSSVLTAGRDPFFSAAAYNFSPVRFKVRGYDGEYFTTNINGIPFENLDNGFSTYGLWGGLNDVMRNRTLSIGLQQNLFAFGGIGTAVNIDARAGKQRKQTEFGYAYSNRNYTHRFSITHSTGFNKKGWAFSFSGSRRWADEGYVPGTYYNGWSYFMAVDKKLNKRNTLSLTFFGSPTEYGRQGAATQEAYDLAGTHYYNSYWGYQNGKKRNANIAKTNQPQLILTHELKLNNKTTLTTGAGYSFGDKSSGGFDWYNVLDPRPDYYKKMPSYYQNNPAIYALMVNQWKTNENVRQIDWAGLYNANYSDVETFNGVTGKRSRYLLSDAVNNIQKFTFNSTLNAALGKRSELTAGFAYQAQKNNFFRRVTDLLGGDYFPDLNQFAERSFPNNPNAAQSDLNNPNRVVYVGDRYKYDYDITINKAQAWAQYILKFKRVDIFGAAELSNTQFWRTGHMRNGLFPNSSFGKGAVNNFNNYALKAGITYKINGRNYLYANGAVLTRAPYYENVYASPRTRDDEQPNVVSENITTTEAGYILNAPKIRLRITGYYTEFKNSMTVTSFYHDTYQNLVNYAIRNINKQHFGMEFGFNAKILPNLTLDGAASVGRYYYNSRQNATISLDNDATILSSDTVYANGYRIGNTPQEVYSLGFTYRSPKYWFISITGNYFDQMWMEFNPIRRTNKAVENTAIGSPEREAILAQQQFPSQYTVDIFAGYSWKLPRAWSIKKKPTFLVFNAGISNIANNQNIIAAGFEQLRFDYNTGDVNMFPPKYSYSYGLNYFLNMTLRF